MKDQVEDAERRRLEDLNRSRRERGLIRAVHELEGRSFPDQGRRGERDRPSRGGRSMGDPGRPLYPQGSEVNYDRIAEIVQKAFKEREGPSLRVGTKAICQRLEISRTTLFRWMKQHRIPFERHGQKLLFDVAAIDAALKKFRIRAAGD